MHMQLSMISILGFFFQVNQELNDTHKALSVQNPKWLVLLHLSLSF